MGNPVKVTTQDLDALGMSPVEKIELAARICYNSEDKAKPGGAEAFLKGQILSRGHESVIEHEGLVFSVICDYRVLLNFMSKVPVHSFVQVQVWDDKDQIVRAIISGNFRVWRDHFKLNPTNELAFLIMKTVNEEYSLFSKLIFDDPGPLTCDIKLLSTTSTYAVQEGVAEDFRMKHGTFTCRIDGVSRAFTHQLVRHRPVAYSQRSQRYCGEADFNYIVPPALEGIVGTTTTKGEDTLAIIHFGDIMETISQYYGLFQNCGLKNEDARFILPNACETNIVVTATLNQFRHMILLRTSRHAQWEIREVFKQINQLIAKRCPGLGFEDLVFED